MIVDGFIFSLKPLEKKHETKSSVYISFGIFQVKVKVDIRREVLIIGIKITPVLELSWRLFRSTHILDTHTHTHHLKNNWDLCFGIVAICNLK